LLSKEIEKGGNIGKNGRETGSKKEERIGNTWNATGDIVKMSKEGKMERVKTKLKNQYRNQCSGSESDPDPLVQSTGPDPSNFSLKC